MNNDCLSVIFSFLEMNDIGNCRLTNKQFNRIIVTRYDWLGLCRKKYAGITDYLRQKTPYNTYILCVALHKIYDYFHYKSWSCIWPDTVMSLYNTKVFDKSCNETNKQLPKQIGFLSKLTNIWLPMGSLTVLPTEIGQLTALQVLNVSGNMLVEIPNEIGKLVNLQVLNLSKNKISRIPDEVYQLTKLETFEYQHNPISHISNDIYNLVNIKTLGLSIDGKLPNKLVQMTMLYSLKISGKNVKISKKLSERPGLEIIQFH